MVQKRARLAEWVRRVCENLDVYTAILICVAAVVCLVVGWAFRPTVGAPPLEPSPPMLTISFSAPQPAPRELDINSILEQESNSQTVLKVDLAGVFEPGQTTVNWSVAVQQFTGSICTPKPNQASVTPIGPGNYSISGTSPVTTHGIPFTLLHLCWSSGSPLAITSSYISANLPVIVAPAAESGTLIRELGAGSTALADYSLVGGIAPTILTSANWQWQSSYGANSESQAQYPIPVFASSIIGAQQANRDTFISGILFGVAGGALISVLLGLPDLVDRWRERQRARDEKPAQGSGTRDGEPSSDASSSIPS
jgi:hypothetical protein